VGEILTIDLSEIRTEDDLLDLLGVELELGGPDGNCHVSAGNAGRGWGKNWNALNDSLRYLPDGGIWGTSRRFAFPLHIEFVNVAAYRFSDKADYSTLVDILSSTQRCYAKERQTFSFSFK
jgi:hypothetical protein